MPNSRHMSVIGSPSRSRATKRSRSSIAELSFHGIHTSRSKKAKSVTHVSGTKCHLCLRLLNEASVGKEGEQLGVDLIPVHGRNALRCAPMGTALFLKRRVYQQVD